MGAKATILIGAGMLTLVPAGPLVAQGTGAEAEVRAAVRVCEAAWKAGDVERLRGVMAPHGVVVWTSASGSETSVESMTFDQLVENQRPQTVYELERVLSVNVADDQMATVDAEIRTDDGHYRDHYVLYQAGGRWWIAVKTFVFFPDEGA